MQDLSCPYKMKLEPAQLLKDHWRLINDSNLNGPVLDLACGYGHNAIYLALKGLTVSCCDKSEDALKRTRATAAAYDVNIDIWKADLEKEAYNPLKDKTYKSILVFRYLHRPLIPHIREALHPGGILMYETFTIAQPRFGKPHNPTHLLDFGELLDWFKDGHIFHYFEGIRQAPQRAVAQIVCRMPG
jgi:tellurite methyltransferase